LSQSIVAIHGINETLIDAWTDPTTRVLWLRDLLPTSLRAIRVLTFGYDASPSRILGPGGPEQLRLHAETLVASLQANRSIEGCDQRPIIFFCHDLGGTLLKKALAYSARCTSSQVYHCYSIYLSTYAILFFGTPHTNISQSGWANLQSISIRNPDSSLSAVGKCLTASASDLDAFNLVTAEFAPLMKQFYIFFFWEEIQTNFGSRSRFVVEQSSAAPIIDNTERCGIYATHAGMVRFSNSSSTSYQTVIAALTRYCKTAPQIINHRWQQARKALHQARLSEASELTGLVFDVHEKDQPLHPLPVTKKRYNQHFYVPPGNKYDFFGRQDAFESLAKAFFSSQSPRLSRKQKIYVVYGMGGSGKTHFCSKFARDHQER
jgi:hypothetical protein